MKFKKSNRTLLIWWELNMIFLFRAWNRKTAKLWDKQNNMSTASDLLCEGPCYFHQHINLPTGNQGSNDSCDYWFCPSWSIRAGSCERPLCDTGHIDSSPTHRRWQQMYFPTLNLIRTHSDREEIQGFICVTWSWWSKKVLMHALEPASQTFTLLSDELRAAEDREHFLLNQTLCCSVLIISSASGGKIMPPTLVWSFTLRQSGCHLGRRRH